MDAHHLPNIFSSIVATACRVVPDLAHVDPSTILVCVRKLPPTRLGETLGLRQASRRQRRAVAFPAMVVDGREILYVITFNVSLVSTITPPRQALETVMHELWHLAEECDGTIRPVRHGKGFDASVAVLHDAYVSVGGRPVPTFEAHARVRLRHLAGRSRRRTDVPLRERTAILSKLLPTTIAYTCPRGHEAIRHRRLSKPSSCAICSPTFDPRYLLKRKTA